MPRVLVLGLLFLVWSPVAVNAGPRPGDVLIVETNRDKIVALNPQTRVQSVVSSGGLFQYPQDIAVSSAGIIYVSNPGAGGTSSSNILAIDPVTGEQSILSTGGELSEPRGIDIGPDGRLYVVDILYGVGTGRLIRIDPSSGAQEVVARVPGYSRAVAIARDGSAYIGVQSEFVEVVDPGTTWTRVLPSFGDTEDLVLDADGSILVLSSSDGNMMIYRLDPATGSRTIVLRGPWQQPFNQPRNLTVASDGSCFVTDVRGAYPSYGLVYRVSPTGAVLKMADGYWLESPRGIAIYPPSGVTRAANQSWGRIKTLYR